jgi:hypothetical protein
VRFEEIIRQTRWPRPQTCELEQARADELRELLAFESEWQALHRVPARERERLIHEAKMELFTVWDREDTQPEGNNRSSRTVAEPRGNRGDPGKPGGVNPQGRPPS